MSTDNAELTADDHIDLGRLGIATRHAQNAAVLHQAGVRARTWSDTCFIVESLSPAALAFFVASSEQREIDALRKSGTATVKRLLANAAPAPRRAKPAADVSMR